MVKGPLVKGPFLLSLVNFKLEVRIKLREAVSNGQILTTPGGPIAMRLWFGFPGWFSSSLWVKLCNMVLMSGSHGH